MALNRFVLTVQTLALPTLSFDRFLSYTPSWQETGTFLAVVAYGVLVYSFSFRYFQLFPAERELKFGAGRPMKVSVGREISTCCHGTMDFIWTAGHIVFLGAFYTVLAVVGHHAGECGPALAPGAARRARLERIRWHSEFHDLPAGDRVCRHVLTGELESRECPHAFDCRECETHAKLVEHHAA